MSLRLQRLIDQMDYGPAWVFGERWDVVAWNRAASVIHGDLATLQGIERNALYQLFLGDRMRSILADWEIHGRSASPSCGRPTPAGWTTPGSTSW